MEPLSEENIENLVKALNHYKQNPSRIPIPEFEIFVGNMANPQSYVTSNFNLEQLDGHEPLHRAIRMEEGQKEFWELYWDPREKVLEVPGYGVVKRGESYHKLNPQAERKNPNLTRRKREDKRYHDPDRRGDD